jgi:hypothetical protein
MIFGCYNYLNKIISRKIRRDSCLFSRKRVIFLIATFRFVFKSIAAITVEETPFPIILDSI